jgi:hypothetical protein
MIRLVLSGFMNNILFHDKISPLKSKSFMQYGSQTYPIQVGYLASRSNLH